MIKYWFVIFAALLLPFCASYGEEPTTTDEKPSLLLADELVYERDFGLIIARGNVEIYHQGTRLFADTVTYNQTLDRITASGHIRLTEPKGNITFLDYAELTGDLKQGFITHIRILMTDNGRLAGESGERKKGIESIIKKGVYSPCALCKKDPTKPPLWQIKAEAVHWDEENHNIIYHNALMEMLGVPVAYVPYFKHADPTVKRRSGFLAPTIGASSNLGTVIALPYYWVVDDQTDLTVTPAYVAKNQFPLLLSAEYRHRFRRGEFTVAGSITKGDRVERIDPSNMQHKDRFRGHVLSSGKFDLNSRWRAGFNLERTTDDTYLRRFNFLNLSSRTSLVSKGFLEGFYGRNYALVESYSFQGLRANDVGKRTPMVLPMVSYNYLSHPGRFKEQWSWDSSILNLARPKGDEMQRLVTIGGVSVPFMSPLGDVYSVGAKVRGDFYHSTQLRNSPQNITTLDSTKGRLFPQLYGTWRYPWVRPSSMTNIIVEPIAGFVMATNPGQPAQIPNEDSHLLEFNTYNLFSESRFGGLDRLDGGSRVNYGFNLSSLSSTYGNTNLFLGQSYAFQSPRPYLSQTGLDKRLSDYVGSLKFNYKTWFTLKSRLLLDRKFLRARRHELYGRFGQPILNLESIYALLPSLADDPDSRKAEQVSFALNSQFHENWSGSITTTRGLGTGSGQLSQGIGLNYGDECFVFSTTLTKTFYRDRDIKPGTTLLFRLVFKNIGEIRQETSIFRPDATDKQTDKPGLSIF